MAGAQSAAVLHWTQLPAPSHLVSPPSWVEQAVPAVAKVVPQQPPVQSLTTHELVWAGHAEAAVHAMPPSQVGPVSGPESATLPPVPEVVDVVLEPPVPTEPPEPPVPGMRERSTEAMSSQPVMLAVMAPAATMMAVRMLMWLFIARILRT